MENDSTEDLLDRDTWEGLSARLVGLDTVARVEELERAEIDAAVYQASEAHWARVMVAEILAGDRDAARRYGARCAEALAKRKEAAAAAPAIAPATPAASVADPSANARSAPLPSPVAAVVPTYLREQPSPPKVSVPLSPSPAAMPKFGTLAVMPERAARPTLPFVAGASGAHAPVPAAPSAAREAPSGDPMDQTLETAGGIVAAPLPFEPNKKGGA